jgi:hypothetical protein
MSTKTSTTKKSVTVHKASAVGPSTYRPRTKAKIVDESRNETPDSPPVLTEKQRKILKEVAKRQKLRSYTDPRTGFQAFCEAEVKILPKNRKEGFKKFIFNEAQIILTQEVETQRAETGRVRVIILKARQQGISTWATSRVFHHCKFQGNTSAVIMAHDGPTSEALFTMSKNIVDEMSAEFKPDLEKSTAREIIFADNKSSYRLFTAGSPESGRGVTPTIAHLSEVAFWPHDQKILAGLFQGIPSSEGTEIILESTANGIGNEFHRLWMEAQDGKSEYKPIFIPWFLTSEYRRAAPPGFERTEEEELLVKKFKLDDDQLYWRRLKILESGENTFKQEYPSTPQEAFISSGSSVFDKEKLALYIPQPILRSMEYDPTSNSLVQVSLNSGSLKIFRHHDYTDKFVIGADVALGVGKDYSVAVVMDSLKRVHALYRNNLIDPSMFGDVLFYISRLFNNGMLGVESNSMGVSTINRLVQMKHQNLYRPSRNANTQQQPGEDAPIGWKTTHTSKPGIIGNLKRAIENEEIWIPSTIMISECQTYIMKDNGGTEAAAGSTDDTVMGLAIALEMIRTHGDKLTNDRTPFGEKFRPAINVADETIWL